MKLGEAQKSSPEAPESLENDLKIKNIDVHDTVKIEMKIIDVPSSEGQLGVRIRLQEARQLRRTELEGAESKRRNTK